MNDYYTDQLIQKSYMIGALENHVKYLAKLIQTHSEQDWVKQQAVDTLAHLENLHAEAIKYANELNEKTKNLTESSMR